MKKFVLLLFVLCFVNLTNAQETSTHSKIKTSLIEYNYLTKLYPLEDEATMLSGYRLDDFFQTTVGKYNFNYRVFVEVKTEKVKAVFIIMKKLKKKKDKVEYLCLPFNNSALFSQFNKDVESIGITMGLTFDSLNRFLLSKLLNEKLNK